MAESEEQLKSLLIKVKEESEKIGLKFNIQTTKIMAFGPITSWQIDGETVATVADFIFWGSKITVDDDCSHEIKRRLLLGTKEWFQIRKGVHQGCILSPCLFNLYAEYIMKNAGLDEAQAGIKIARRNINSLRYKDDTTLMAEIKELKSLLMKVKEKSETAGLKLNIHHLVPSLHGKQMGREWKQSETLFFEAPKSLQVVSAAMKLKDTCSLE